jgi:putative ABC transport system permease protein
MNWSSMFGRRRWEQRMDAEFRFHLESQIGEYVSQGLSREEAELRARQEFGPVDLAKDECRDERPVQWLDTLWRDVRYACRGLLGSPGFVWAAVLTLALGIGANTAIFSAVYAVLMKPLPYADPDRIYSVEVVIPERRSQFASLPVPVQLYLEWRKTRAFDGMAALRPWECNLTGDGEPERVGGARVSANFFSFLGTGIAHGRSFTSDEEQPGREKVVVISDALWRRRYGSDPALTGRRMEINGESHLVVGVAAPALLPSGSQLHSVLAFHPRIDIFKPIAPTARELQGESWDHGLLVRLRQGQTSERGEQQLQAGLDHYAQVSAPGMKMDLIPQLVPIREIFAGKVRLRLLLILAASALLLLTACINVANLFLARMAGRTGEFALRVALGAGKHRILSQTVTEAVLVALLGGAAGTALAGYGARLLARYGPDELRLMAGATLHLPVLLFALTASLLVGLVCGIFSALQFYRKDVASGIQEGSRASLGTGRSARFRKILVAVEMSLGTALLASAGLLLHSFVKLLAADRGYEVERVLAVDLSLFGQRYSSSDSRVAFYRETVESVRALPGVHAAGAISDLPAVADSSGNSRTIFHPTDTDFQSLVLARPVAMIRSVTSGYFAASGTSLRAGRFFNSSEKSLVALVSESLAKRLWPGESAEAIVGRTLRQGNVKGPLITVAGVVGDVRPGAVDRQSPPILYRPHEQWASGPMTLVVKTAHDPGLSAPVVRSAIRKMDPNLPIPAIRTMREIVSTTVAERRFQLMLTCLFAMLALLLGAVGLYGVVSYSVTCRTRDIGLRIALGAMRGDVVRWVLSDGMRPVITGLIIGLAAAMGLAQGLRSLLFGIAPTDPLALSVVVLVLLFTSGLACYLPARRAAALDPMAALRHE